MRPEGTWMSKAHLWLGYVHQQNRNGSDAALHYAEGLRTIPGASSSPSPHSSSHATCAEFSADRCWGLTNYAACLAEGGRHNEAEEVAKKGLDLVEQQYGADSVRFAASLSNYSAYLERSSSLSSPIPSFFLRPLSK